MAKIITDSKKIDELLSRGVEEVIVKEHLREALLSGKELRVKLGIDPTSPSIHLGRAVVLRKLRAFQELGHQVMFIVGDFTGVIGDTSDKDVERPMLGEATIKENMKTYFAQAFKVLDKKQTEVYYNSKWLRKLGFHEIGRLADLFGLHEFEARENIAKRMKEGKRVSLREVLYPLMQGYDSVAVKADVEIGGTDQKFNLLAGRTIQPAYKMPPQDILMTTLLEGTDGRKMSSSWGNVINITDEPNEMFGKVMSLGDGLIAKYFLLATNVSRETISEILGKGPRDAKLELAKEIVNLYHGRDSGNEAKEWFLRVFSKKEIPEDVEILDMNLNPEIRLHYSDFRKLGGVGLAYVLVCKPFTVLASNSEAHRLLAQRGVKVNGKIVTDPKFIVKSGDVVSVGKHRIFRIKI